METSVERPQVAPSVEQEPASPVAAQPLTQPVEHSDVSLPEPVAAPPQEIAPSLEPQNLPPAASEPSAPVDVFKLGTTDTDLESLAATLTAERAAH